MTPMRYIRPGTEAVGEVTELLDLGRGHRLLTWPGGPVENMMTYDVSTDGQVGHHGAVAVNGPDGDVFD